MQTHKQTRRIYTHPRTQNAPLYAHCLDMLFKESVTNLHYEDIRKLSAALNVIANQKQTAVCGRAQHRELFRVCH